MRKSIARSSWIKALAVPVFWLGARMPFAYFFISDKNPAAVWVELAKMLPREAFYGFVLGVVTLFWCEIERRYKARKARERQV